MSVWRDIAAGSRSLFGLRSHEAIDEGAGVLARAKVLVAEGRLLEAIKYATEQNHRLQNPMLEWLLVQWRHDAFASLGASEPRPDWPPALSDPFPGLKGLPEIQASELTSELMGGSILHHGCLIVRGLFNPEEASNFVTNVDRAFSACEAARAGESIGKTLPWYAPFAMGKDPARDVVYPGGILTADSPRLFFELLNIFEVKRIPEIIGEYLGERPALSVKKSTLRKVPFTTGTSWHQDGAFLGADTRTVNLWVALSHCGIDAPGLDIVPCHIPYIVQTGTEGSYFDWDVSDELVKAKFEETALVSPVFEPGDAVLFDQLLLHRTGVKPGMTKDRYAIESWFFAPSTYPEDRIPLVI